MAKSEISKPVAIALIAAAVVLAFAVWWFLSGRETGVSVDTGTQTTNEEGGPGWRKEGERRGNR